MATVTLGGNPIHTNGELPGVGSKAPDFILVGSDLKDVKLSDFKGKKKVLSIVPSLDTGVCAESTRKFNGKAASLADTVVLVISADLPFAQKRFCAAEKLHNVIPLSLMRGRGFAKAYGVLITDGPFEGVCARAIVVLDAQDTVRHTELVKEIGEEHDYARALGALS